MATDEETVRKMGLELQALINAQPQDFQEQILNLAAEQQVICKEVRSRGRSQVSHFFCIKTLFKAKNAFFFRQLSQVGDEEAARELGLEVETLVNCSQDQFKTLVQNLDREQVKFCRDMRRRGKNRV
jgi:hypothetical protein